jgi:hypothetical protein
MDLSSGAELILNTSTNAVTISLVFTTFGIMLLSQLYMETGVMKVLSESLGRIVKNPKVSIILLPAIIGLLPVSGGALMSAPIVETEANKLGLKPDKKTYLNIWFRHMIFPIYPLSEVFILTAALTKVPFFSLVIRQVPVVMVMLAMGYLIGLRGSPAKNGDEYSKDSLVASLKSFLKAFSPILATIAIAVAFIDISLAVFIGIGLLIFMAKPSLNILANTFRNRSVYMVTLAAYGAMLLRDAIRNSGILEIFGETITNAGVSEIVLLLAIPALLGFLIGAFGGIAVGVPILTERLNFTSKTAPLLYTSAYLGFLGGPTHLCFVLTADYFKCPLSQIYKYLVPSITASIIMAVLVYLLF